MQTKIISVLSVVVNKEKLSPHVIKLETNHCGKMYYMLQHMANWYTWATILLLVQQVKPGKNHRT